MLQQEWHARVRCSGETVSEGRKERRQSEALGGQTRAACNIMAADDGLDELISFLRNDRREVILNLAKVADGYFAHSDSPRMCTQTTDTFLGASDGR